MEDGSLSAREGRSVEESLFADPTAFSFYQAVRVLERRDRQRSPVGHFAAPADEAVHFSAHASIAFPASEIQAIDHAGSAAPTLLVNFFGLTGPQGVLPYWYTMLVADQLRKRRTALASFLDIFQHRMLSHLYRAWAKPRAPIEHERAQDDRPARDRTTLLLRALVGLPPRLRTGEHRIHEDTLLFYSGLFGQHHRSAVAFEQMVSDYFEVPVEVLQFVGAWYRVPDHSRCRIGEREDSTTALGVGTVVGDEIWDPQVRVRLRIGPLTKRQFDDFLPSGSAYGELQELSRLFAGDEVDFELQLVLGKDAVPPFVLDSDDSALQLGWNTWIRTAPFVRDTDDTTLTL